MNEKIREDFERYVYKIFPTFTVWKMDNGTYVQGTIQEEWIKWKVEPKSRRQYENQNYCRPKSQVHD